MAINYMAEAISKISSDLGNRIAKNEDRAYRTGRDAVASRYKREEEERQFYYKDKQLKMQKRAENRIIEELNRKKAVASGANSVVGNMFGEKYEKAIVDLPLVEQDRKAVELATKAIEAGSLDSTYKDLASGKTKFRTFMASDTRNDTVDKLQKDMYSDKEYQKELLTKYGTDGYYESMLDLAYNPDEVIDFKDYYKRVMDKATANNATLDEQKTISADITTRYGNASNGKISDTNKQRIKILDKVMSSKRAELNAVYKAKVKGTNWSPKVKGDSPTTIKANNVAYKKSAITNANIDKDLKKVAETNKVLNLLDGSSWWADLDRNDVVNDKHLEVNGKWYSWADVKANTDPRILKIAVLNTYDGTNTLDTGIFEKELKKAYNKYNTDLSYYSGANKFAKATKEYKEQGKLLNEDYSLQVGKYLKSSNTAKGISAYDTFKQMRSDFTKAGRN